MCYHSTVLSVQTMSVNCGPLSTAIESLEMVFITTVTDVEYLSCRCFYSVQHMYGLWMVPDDSCQDLCNGSWQVQSDIGKRPE